MGSGVHGRYVVPGCLEHEILRCVRDVVLVGGRYVRLFAFWIRRLT